jgi:hypothetical protein
MRSGGGGDFFAACATLAADALGAADTTLEAGLGGAAGFAATEALAGAGFATGLAATVFAAGFFAVNFGFSAFFGLAGLVAARLVGM